MSTKRFIAKHGLDNNNQTITNVSDPINVTDVAIKRTTDNLSNTVNISYNTANSAWAGANASYTYASSTANNAYITANNAWNAANTANTWLQANDYNTLVAAYANDSSTLTSSKLYTDNANNWLQANDVVTLNNSKNYSNTIYSIVSSTTNNAFDRANTAYSQANASYTYSSSTANNAYNTANSAWAGANASYTYASSTANNAYITANNAWNAANTANTWLQANDAVTLASAKANDYNTLVAAYANDSSTLTSSKLYTDNANTWLQANDVVTLSTAKNYSNSIYSIISSTANNAYITANNAWDDANAAFDRANTAYAQANASYTYASSTANNAYITANSAWNAANTANTYRANASNLTAGTIPGDRGVSAGSATPSFVEYNGTTATAGQFDGGATTPTGTTRLNYGGYFYPTFINLVGSADTATAASHYFVEQASDGFVRPKTLANVQAEVVTNAVLGSGTANSSTYLRGDRTWQTISEFSTTDDTSTSATYYPVFATTAGGSTAKTSSTKLYFDPSTGTLSATRFNSLSDETKKTNIKEITDATNTLKKIEAVEFNWKDNGDKSAGVIAQQLETILPWLVGEAEGIKSVNYSGLIGYLIQANKELAERIEKLENN